MYVFKKGSSWVYRFDIAKKDGKRQRKQGSGFKTEKEAKVAGAKAYQEYNNSGILFSPSEMSVSDYYELWIKDYCIINCKPTTIEGYKKRIKNYIKPVIGKYKLCSLTPASLQNLINDLFNRGFSRNTLISIKGLLTGAFDYAVHPLKLMQHNPANAIRLPSHRATPKIPTRKKTKKPLEDDQLQVIFKRFPEGHSCHIPIQLASRAGLREGEVFGLQWKDVDLDGGKLSVNQQVQIIDGAWTLVPPKYDSIREFYIDSKLIELLRKTKSQQEANRIEYAEHYTRLFVNSKYQIVKHDTGDEIFLVNVRCDGSYIQPRVVAHLGRIVHYQLGFKDYDFHSLRHTHSTKLHTNGASLLDIKERLGHCDIKTTEIYTHDSETLRQRTKKILEEVYD